MPGALIGEIVIPSELFVPEYTGNDSVSISGAKLFISGGKLNFTVGNVTEAITSS